MTMLENRAPIVLRTKHRPSFHHLDPLGHLSTPHYLAFFLDHRWVAFRERFGVDFAAIARFPFGIVVRRANVEFIRPIYGDEEFEIVSKATAVGEVDATFDLQMLRADGKPAATCELNMVIISKETKRPMAPPVEFTNLLFDPSSAR